MTPDNAFRASDREREQTAERLRHAAGEGRLLPEELEQRLRAAFAARTWGELEAVVGDLPSPRAPTSPRQLSLLARLRPVVPWLVALAALLLILIAAGADMRGRVSSAAPVPAAQTGPSAPQP
jgi:hypothetical protein